MSPVANENAKRESSIVAGYKGGEEMPLAPFSLFMGLYFAAFGGFLALARKTGKKFPDRIGFKDLILLGIATHKVSRLITRDWVTSPIRAPFTEYKGSSGAGEVTERPRGRGMKYATGALLNCPWCTGAWVAAFFTYGLVLKPRLTRVIAAMFNVEAVADYLHLAYKAAKKSQK